MKTNRKRRVLIIGTLFISLILLFGYYTVMERKAVVSTMANTENVSLCFSVDEAFQTQDFEVAITASDGHSLQGMEIYYTTDGSEPTIDSKRYKEPINFSVSNDCEVHILKAGIAYHGVLGPITTKTYFCGTSIPNRYDLPVISITIPEEELYDTDSGIFTHRDKRSESWARAAHVEILTPDGTTMVDQNVGLSVAGASSSAYTVVPLKIDAGTQWDSKNKILNIPNLFKSDSILFSPDYQCLEKLPSLRLKNGGSFDYYKSVVREATCYSLAKDAGLTPLTDMYPAVVYLNGEYYAVMQMCATYSVTNLADIYQLEKEQVQLVKGKEQDIATILAGKPHLLTADYNDSAIIEEFESTFDVTNFLQYYAFELLTDNRDWPNKNVAAWYYSGASDVNNPYTDGKIRFLYYDGSATYRMITEEREIFEVLLDNPPEDMCWLYHVLQNPEYKRSFINIMCDMLNTSLSVEHVHSVIDCENSYLETETKYLAQSDIPEIADIYAQRESSVSIFHDKIDETLWNVRVGMTQYLGADYFNENAWYTLSVTTPVDGVSIHCNSLLLNSDDGDYEGMYFTNYPALLQAVTRDGYTFDGWLVNGSVIQDPALYIMPEMIIDHQVSVEALYHPTEGSTPIIRSLSSADMEDWVALYNPYENDIYLGHFYLSDDSSNLLRYQLPAITLHSGESINIYGMNGIPLGTYKMNMNLKCGETLYLSDSQPDILDSVFIPTMTEKDIYERFRDSKEWIIRHRN